jgi:hypothetical protein
MRAHPLAEISSLAVAAAWEKSMTQPPLLRALTLLQMAEPDTPLEQLARLCIGERDRRLLDLRERLSGSRFDSTANCPRCEERCELSFDSDDLRSHGAATESGVVQFVHDDWTLHARLPETADLMAVARCATPNAGRVLLERCLTRVEVRGVAAAPQAIPPEVVAALQDALAMADPMADLEIGVTCPACGEPYTMAFDIAAYLWQEVDVRARRALRDTHTLARVYGWHESDILAMSDFRRQHYLEMVAEQ